MEAGLGCQDHRHELAEGHMAAALEEDVKGDPGLAGSAGQPPQVSWGFDDDEGIVDLDEPEEYDEDEGFGGPMSWG